MKLRRAAEFARAKFRPRERAGEFRRLGISLRTRACSIWRSEMCCRGIDCFERETAFVSSARGYDEEESLWDCESIASDGFHFMFDGAYHRLS